MHKQILSLRRTASYGYINRKKLRLNLVPDFCDADITSRTLHYGLILHCEHIASIWVLIIFLLYWAGFSNPALTDIQKFPSLAKVQLVFSKVRKIKIYHHSLVIPNRFHAHWTKWERKPHCYSLGWVSKCAACIAGISLEHWEPSSSVCWLVDYFRYKNKRKVYGTDEDVSRPE